MSEPVTVSTIKAKWEWLKTGFIDSQKIAVAGAFLQFLDVALENKGELEVFWQQKFNEKFSAANWARLQTEIAVRDHIAPNIKLWIRNTTELRPEVMRNRARGHAVDKLFTRFAVECCQAITDFIERMADSAELELASSTDKPQLLWIHEVAATKMEALVKKIHTSF